MAIVTGTDADENVGTGFPWISPTVTFDPEGADLSGDDAIYGMGGDDALSGGLGTDTLYGGDGNDTLIPYGNDLVYGGAGGDLVQVFSGGGASVIHGGEGYDVLAPLGYIDFTHTQISGMEELVATVWQITLTADQLGEFALVSGRGNTTAQGEIRLDGGGSARFAIDSGLPTLRINGSSEAEKLVVDPATTSRLLYFGGLGAGDVTGARGVDWLYGGDGSDTLNGGFGDDVLFGGDQNDVLIGGPGDDVLDGGPGRDRVSYLSAGGGVTIDLRLVVSQDTGAAGRDSIHNVEDVTGSRHDDDLTGTDGNNWLAGNDGADVLNGLDGRDELRGGTGDDLLFGGSGRDTLVGGKGDDTLDGGLGSDVFVFATGDGNDVILDWERGLDRLDLTGIAGVNGPRDITIAAVSGGVEVIAGDVTIMLLSIDPADLPPPSFLF